MTFASYQNRPVANRGMTIRELRGINDDEFAAALSAAQKLLDGGAEEAAVDVLAGLAMYDPFCPEVWRLVEQLCRRRGEPEAANLFAGLSRAMAA
ncbi:MAG: hypothetical protein DRI34_01110 [Deltaproteobacteria bacterium]|nr:MAG: hypothetical protein DRI34_01110 [Deltaproteobacteria bacterium]